MRRPDVMDDDKDPPLPRIDTRPRHRRTIRGALLLAALALLYVTFLFTRDAGFLAVGPF